MAKAPPEDRGVEHILADVDFSTDIRVRDAALGRLAKRIEEAPVDTREALAGFEPIGDQYQQKVIRSSEQAIRLVAPAGSGKTQTIVNRALYRIKNGLNPERLLILTFDNAALSSLRATLEAAHIPLEGLRISTLNAYGYGVLRDYFPAEYKRVIPPDWKPRRLLREVREALRDLSAERYAALPNNLEGRFYLDFIGLLKNSLFDPRNPDAQGIADLMLERREAEPFFADPKDGALVKRAIQAVIWMFQAYEKVMQRDAVLDFDDQKLRAYVMLRDTPGVLQAVQARLTEVIVDEFQDINLLDFEFIKALAAKAIAVYVGDDDQAIYGFRGCSPDFIIDLEERLAKPLASYELSINYRCPPNIVDHADKLIRHSVRRIPKTPVAHSRTPSQIKIVSTLSAALEAKTIVSFIRRVMKSSPTLDFNDFAVLYRTNAQSLPLQIQFILNDIPYFVRERDNILANESLERLLGVLRVKLAIERRQIPTSRDQLLTVRAYFRHVDADEAARLERLFARREDFLETLSSEEFFAILGFARESHIQRAVGQVLTAPTLLDALDILGKRFRGLQGMIGSLEDVLDERVPLGEVYDLALDFKGNADDFVRMLDRALERARAVEAGRQEESGVSLLTYFKSKGRQWHTVILTTCNEGLIPHKKAPVEDERRLFYVALTRSSANLLISYVKSVCGSKVVPSRFLKEAGLI